MNPQQLFTPTQLGRIHLRNRIVMAPMTRNRATPDGLPTAMMVEHYAQRADAGLIVAEGTWPEVTGQAYCRQPGIETAEQVRAWQRVTDAVHARGGSIVLQIMHSGRIGSRHIKPAGVRSVSASAIQAAGQIWTDAAGMQDHDVPVALTTEEVRAAIATHAAAAQRAIDAGFDGVELHGAHGYLIDQFFWKETNRRTDEYGGDLTGRTRFASRIIHAVRKAVGSQFPIIFRFSQWKTGHYNAKLAYTPMELEAFLAPLTDAGVDIFDCSTRRFWEPEFEGSRLNLAGWTRKLTGKPTISVGSVGLKGDFTNAFDGGPEAEAASVEPLAERLKAGEFDLIAVGRALLADAEWAEKIRHAREKDIHLFTKEDLKTLK